MENTASKYEFLASFFLPNGILDLFDYIKATEEPIERKGEACIGFKLSLANQTWSFAGVPDNHYLSSTV